MERIVIGYSENTEAEYAFKSDLPVSLLILDQNDACISVEGFSSIKQAKNSIAEELYSSIEWLI